MTDLVCVCVLPSVVLKYEYWMDRSVKQHKQGTSISKAGTERVYQRNDLITKPRIHNYYGVHYPPPETVSYLDGLEASWCRPNVAHCREQYQQQIRQKSVGFSESQSGNT